MTRKKRKQTSKQVSKREEYIYKLKSECLIERGLPVTTENLKAITIYTYWEIF